MSNYSPIVNYAAKDALSSGDPLKRIKGTEISAEFTAIATMSATKADLASPTFTGTPSAPTAAAGTNTTQLATTAFSYLSIANLITGITGVNGWVLSAANTPALYSNSAQRATVNSTGNWSVVAPSSGTTLTLNAVTSANALVMSDGTTNTMAVLTAGLYFGTSSNHLVAIRTNNADRLTFATTGALTVADPTGGTIPLTVNGGQIRAKGVSAGTASAIALENNGASRRWRWVNGVGSESDGTLGLFEDIGGRQVFNIVAAGNVTVSQPSSGVALTIAGAALTPTSSQAFTATPTFNASLSNIFEFSGAMTANVTSVTITNPTAGQTITIRVKQDGTGGRTVATPAGAVILGSVGATAGKASLLTLTYSSMDARWEGSWTQLP